ncbi:MAG: uncharacterized membrane protein (UPF0127 family) [Limimaricola cinnabarinus]|jgi:hypothetical protein|uniref:Exported protein n=1 Tax=Limimaricola cinnabarinus LL-001 TaxID=1337093 RepID=U2YKE8_9RHOB|nr:DUF192 domain-containing protein [Limimaricola cinnabarinus]GAD55421.1 exported protein [Limimaricola cinnabarinus LL-001]
MKALLLTALLLGLPVAGLAGGCAPDRVTVRGDWGQAGFAVEIADDAAERAQGLMNRAEMPRMAGMLFVYDAPQAVSFWMRNTLIPLDIIFAGADGVIRSIHPRAKPLDETPIPGGTDIQYVLEINGGMAARLGITEGDTLRHPAIGSEEVPAAAPCD